MTSSASSIILGALIPAPALAQAPEDTARVLPPELEGRIQATIREAWNATGYEIYLSWGIIRDGTSMGKDIDFRLVGDGDDGWFAVLFERQGQPAIAARVRAGVVMPVPVAARSLIVGTVLSSDDFVFEPKVTWGPPSPNHPEGPGEGWITRSPIGRGDIMVPPRVSPPHVVNEGERVKVFWKRGLVSVAIEGTALSSGALGDQVNVRLNGRRGRVRVTATGPGTATFNGR